MIAALALMSVVALIAEQHDNARDRWENSRVAVSEVSMVRAFENIDVFDPAIKVNLLNAHSDILYFIGREGVSVPHSLLNAALGSDGRGGSVWYLRDNQLFLIDGLNDGNLSPADHLGGRGLPHITNFGVHPRLVRPPVLGRREHHSIAKAHGAWKHVGPGPRLIRASFVPADPDKAQRHKGEQPGSNRRDGGVLGYDEAGRAIFVNPEVIAQVGDALVRGLVLLSGLGFLWWIHTRLKR